MILTFPNIVLRWHNNKRGICGIEDYITDIEKKRYGYDLTDGQRVYCIQYDGLTGHSFIMYDAHIEKADDKGLLIDEWFTKGWDTDDALEWGLVRADTKAFLPWELKDGVLQLQPCPSFYENYKVKDLIKHTARLNEDRVVGGKLYADPKGSGLFFKHGGYRTTNRKYEGNIDNIVKLGQMELEL